MAITAFLIWIPPIVAGVACGLLAYAGMSGLADLAILHRRLTFTDQLQQIFQERKKTFASVQSRRFPLQFPIGLAVGLVLAILWHHPVLSPWWIILGGAFGWMMMSTRLFPRQGLNMMEIFVSGLRSSYPVHQSVMLAMEVTVTHLPDTGPGGELKSMVSESLRRYRSSADLHDSLSVLRDSGWPMMRQLCGILEQVSRADENSILVALETLEDQIHAARMLLDRASTILVLNRLTLRSLQFANAAAIVIVSLVPGWHRFYADHPAGLIAATAMVLAGSWYFLSEIQQLEMMLL